MSQPGVLVVQHQQVEDLGAVAPALERRGMVPRCIRSWAGDPVPGTLEAARALIVMGGVMGVYEADRYPALRQEMRLIERALNAGVPVLGICLGSQLLAHVLGAPVCASGSKEIGWHEITLTPAAHTDPLWSGVPGPLTVFQWHGDVFPLPRGAVHLAMSSFTPIQAFRYQNAWGFLFHLEATERIVRDMVASWPEELREEDLDGERIVQQCGRFLPDMAPVAERVFDAFARTL